MQQSMSGLTGAVALLVAAAIWAILFVVILEVLKRACLFQRCARYVLAVCASLLSVIGMSRIFVGGLRRSARAGRGGLFEFLLLPYAAMGTAMLLVLLLPLLRKVVSARQETCQRAEGIYENAQGRCKRPESVNVISPAARQDTGDGLPPPPPPLQQQPGPNGGR